VQIFLQVPTLAIRVELAQAKGGQQIVAVFKKPVPT
jgi:hypothetical protein